MTLQTRPSNSFSRLLSVGGARGSRSVSNEEMCELIDSTPEWIEQRTGIVSRQWATDDESLLSLCTSASKTAIERSGLALADIDAVLVASVSHTQPTPSLAALLADQLGLGDVVAFDISAACAGFCHGVALADGMVRTGSSRHVLVVGAELLSRFTDFNDRTTAFLFSDGAGAVVIGPSDTAGIGPTVWGSAHDQHDAIDAEPWDDLTGPKTYIRMDGRRVFRWATTFIAEKAKETLAAAGLAPEDLDVFIPHQANNRITDSMLRQLQLPESVVVSRNIVAMGNSSAASIPLAMEDLLLTGQASSGDTALVIGFGAGLVYAGQTLLLP